MGLKKASYQLQLKALTLWIFLLSQQPQLFLYQQWIHSSISQKEVASIIGMSKEY